MGATWRPWVNDSDAPANGEASNNTIEVVRNWWRCMDLESMGEAQREAGRGLNYRTSFIWIIFGGVNRHAGHGQVRRARTSRVWSDTKRRSAGLVWIRLVPSGIAFFGERPPEKIVPRTGVEPAS